MNVFGMIGIIMAIIFFASPFIALIIYGIKNFSEGGKDLLISFLLVGVIIGFIFLMVLFLKLGGI